MKDFRDWYKLKSEINNLNKEPFYHEREVCKIQFVSIKKAIIRLLE